MGKEARANQEKIALGKYNVHIEIEYMDGRIVEWNVNSWEHAGSYLALNLDTSMFKVICLNQVRQFTITPQTQLDA